MKDKFKDTEGLDKAYMSLARRYDEHKENAVRQVKEGAFVELLNQEQAELQKVAQVELMTEYMFDYARTLVNIKTATEDSKFINDYKEALKGYANFLFLAGCRKLPEDSIVLSKKELNEIINKTKEAEKNYYKKVVIPQERKETAERLYGLVKEKIEQIEKFYFDNGKIGYNGLTVKELNKLAEQLSVETGE